MLRDLQAVENGRIFPFFAKNGGKSFYFLICKEDTAIALDFSSPEPKADKVSL